MKPLPLVLAASLVANVAFLVTFSTRRADAASSSSSSGAVASAHVSSPAAAGSGSVSAENLVAALKANNLTALRDLLRSAGVPDETIRNVVAAAVWGKYGDFMKTLRPKKSDAWWKQDNDWYRTTSREQRTELRRLQREAQDQIESLLGPAPKSDNQWSDQRYGFLPETKRKDVQEVDQDYQDLLQEIQQDIQGLALPSDTAKIKYLMEEKKRDLAALLSPQELAEYELRNSPTANQLRWKMTKFDGTEEEYRKIFAIQQAATADLPTDAWGNPTSSGPDDWKNRQEREKLANAQIKEALGAERYAEYVRSQNYEYQQLSSLTKRLNLPPDTAKNVYGLRDTASAESARIADNPDLTFEQKKQAFADLAAKTRASVTAALGEEAAGVLIKNSMHWVNSIQSGQVVTFGEDGSQSTRSGLNPPQKKKTAQ